MATEPLSLGEVLREAFDKTGRTYQDAYDEYHRRCEERGIDSRSTKDEAGRPNPYKLKQPGTIGAYVRGDSTPNFVRLMMLVEILNDWLREVGEGPLPIEWRPPLRVVGGDDTNPKFGLKVKAA